MKVEYKYIRENIDTIYYGEYIPVVMNAWSAADAKKVENSFSANDIDLFFGSKHFLAIDYENETVFGSDISATTAGALKGLIANATCAEDFDRSLYFRSITDCTANISGNGVMITTSHDMKITDISTFEEFIYSGHKIDGIACAESISKFQAAGLFGEVADYDENKTYIIVSPQALKDANQEERFNMIAKDIPVVYDKRNHMGIRSMLKAA